MSKEKVTRRIEELLEKQEWGAARRLLEQELAKNPNDHWLLTQIGVTYYEQKHYKDAYGYFLRSLEIVRDCPLTLWNVAGTMAAMDAPANALEVYTYLLLSNKTSEDDPCWENTEWTDSLKVDCLFRAGVCNQKLGKDQLATQLYERYLLLNASGYKGSYPIEDVKNRLQEMRNRSRSLDWHVVLRGVRIKNVQVPQFRFWAGEGFDESWGISRIRNLNFPVETRTKVR